MAARFNRHRPALCAACTKPLSVRERRAGVTEGIGMLCAWDAYQNYRKELESVDGFWMSEPSNPANMHAVLPTEHSIDPFDLFGLHGEEGDLD